ncbi:MAG: T9SS type A sorting domain-containing protein [Flavisolibacter sp.]
MIRIFLLLQVLFCFLLSPAQSVTKTALISSQTGSSSWFATPGISTAVQHNDGVYLKSEIGADLSSNTLTLTSFGFNIPTHAPINGIIVTIKRRSAHTSQITDKNIKLIIGGLQSGDNKASTTVWTNSDQVIKYGAATNKWSVTGLSASKINASNFGIAIQVQNSSSAGAAFIDHVSITVYYSPSVQVPVRFVGFSSKKENAGMLLTWKVHEEDKLLRYEIERSTNGTQFEKIGIVPAKAQEVYTYMDQQPLSGKYFYRIKGVDVDSKFGYSTVLSLNGATSAVVFKVFPTLVQNQLTVQHDAATADSRILISRQDGQLVKNITPTKGAVETRIETASLSKGMYVLKFVNANGNIETMKFMKQ